MQGRSENDKAPPSKHDRPVDPAEVSKRGACKFCKKIMAAASVWRHQLSCKKNNKRILGRHGCKLCGIRFNRLDSYQRHCIKASEMGRCPKRSKPSTPLQSVQPCPDSSSTQPLGEGPWLDSPVSDDRTPYHGEPSPGCLNHQFPMTGYDGSPHSAPPMNAHIRDSQRHSYTSRAGSPPQEDPLTSVDTVAWPVARDDQAPSYHPYPAINYQPQSFDQTFSATSPLQSARPDREYPRYDSETININGLFPGREYSSYDSEAINNVLPLQYESHLGAQSSSSSHWPSPSTLNPPHSNVHQLVPISTAAPLPLGGMPHGGLGHPTIRRFYEATGEFNDIHCGNGTAGEGANRSSDSCWGSHHQSHDTLGRAFPGGSSRLRATQPPVDAISYDGLRNGMLVGSLPELGSQQQPMGPPFHCATYDNPGHSALPQFDQALGRIVAEQYAIVGREPTSTSSGSVSVWGSLPRVNFQWQQPTHPPPDTITRNPGYSTPPQYGQGIGQYAEFYTDDIVGGGSTPPPSGSISEWESHQQFHDRSFT